ncbi:MAG TPA: protein kinase [Pyrinomonadaceae bacterium]|nr:protein kinase [Pyrinomonadaceae bacterium]
MLSNGEKIGHYRINSAIGAGGMGEIYLALDTRLNRDVAIKILPVKWLENDSAVERFMREARAISTLNHPNILTIYDIGEHQNIKFIATEYVEGQTLRQKMSKTTLALNEILDIVIQIAEALSAAHDAGITHRDIKPENIMLRHDGYVKVLDFGIAKLLERKRDKEKEKQREDDETLILSSDFPVTPSLSLTSPGMIVGTVAYMSPEQARGLEIDFRSDIFSLGVMLYELIAGRMPFSGETPSDILAAILKTEPRTLSEIVKNIPSELEWSVAKALCKNIDERYQTIRNFLSDLRKIKQRLEFETVWQRISDSGIETLPETQATRILPKSSVSLVSRKKQTRKSIDSLAVLPLVNFGGDENTEYLSDGITECIINSLTKLPKLRVVPRNTVFRYKGQEIDSQKIGEELDVRALFLGRVMKLGDSIIVKTELIDVAKDSQIWGEQYRRPMTDIFTLLEEIAEEISENLRLKLSGDEKKNLGKRYTDNAEAYQYYLKGRYFVTTKRTEEWIKKGIEFFNKAIDLDPNYALAYSGIAEAYGFFASSTGGWSPNEAYPKAKAAALKALELDDALAEAHCSLGFSLLLYDWDLAGAEREFLQALKLNPNYPNAHDGYGFYLKAVGRHAEAIEKGKLVLQLEPLSTFAHVSLGYAYYFARDYKKAIEECNKALEMDKNLTFAYRNIGLAHLQLGKFEEAISALKNAVKYSCGGLAFESYLGVAFALADRRQEALEVLENLHDLDRECYVPAYNFAMIYASLNELDKAFEWFEQSLKERSGFLPFLKVEPIVDNLRSDVRFQNLLKKIGLEK